MKHVRNALRIFATWLKIMPVDLASFIVVPIAAYGLPEEADHLPEWARWCETYDNTINGPSWWNGPSYANGRARTYKWRVKWLRRNRIGVYKWEHVHLSTIPEGAMFKARWAIKGDMAELWALYAEMRVGAAMWPYYKLEWSPIRGNYRLLCMFGWRFAQDTGPASKWNPKKAEFEFGIRIKRKQ